jgi:hypothetical protein
MISNRGDALVVQLDSFRWHPLRPLRPLRLRFFFPQSKGPVEILRLRHCAPRPIPYFFTQTETPSRMGKMVVNRSCDS